MYLVVGYVVPNYQKFVGLYVGKETWCDSQPTHLLEPQ